MVQVFSHYQDFVLCSAMLGIFRKHQNLDIKKRLEKWLADGENPLHNSK
jgi:hypothetical protein